MDMKVDAIGLLTNAAMLMTCGQGAAQYLCKFRKVGVQGQRG